MSDELTTYEKKVLLSHVPEFCQLVGRTNASAMAEMPVEFLLARSVGLSVLAYLNYEHDENAQEQLDNIAEALDGQRKRDASLEVLAEIQAAKSDEQRASIIASLPERLARIAREIASLENERATVTLAAQTAFQKAFDSAIRYGEVRTAGTNGTAHGNLGTGVYATDFAKHAFRFAFASPDDWAIYSVDKDVVSLIADYDTVSEETAETADCRIASATRARKAIKSTRGYRGNAGLPAVVSAMNASFESFSAGNPTEKNWRLVSSDVAAWKIAAAKGKLPKES